MDMAAAQHAMTSPPSARRASMITSAGEVRGCVGVARVWQGCGKIALRAWQGCGKGMARVCQGCGNGVARVCQGIKRGCVKVVSSMSKVCQGCVKSALLACPLLDLKKTLLPPDVTNF